VRNPLETLARIEPFLGVDLGESRKRVLAGQPLSPGHILCGNRSKATPTLMGEPTAQGNETLSRGPWFVFLAFAGWLQWYYWHAGLTKGRVAPQIRPG
jgi:hypothetical protein